MTRLTQPIVHFLSPDDPGIEDSRAMNAPLMSEELIAGLYRGQRYENAIVSCEPRWRRVIVDRTTG